LHNYKKMKISLIACIGKNRGLGLNNELLYKIPEDLKRFREVTKGHAVIMGSKTFESIGRPLPARTNIIVTKKPGYQAPGCIVVNSIDDAFSRARDVEQSEIFVIGGAQIYAQTIEKADKLYLTLVDGEKPADAFFPPYDEFKKITARSGGDFNGLKYSFLELGK